MQISNVIRCRNFTNLYNYFLFLEDKTSNKNDQYTFSPKLAYLFILIIKKVMKILKLL